MKSASQGAPSTARRTWPRGGVGPDSAHDRRAASRTHIDRRSTPQQQTSHPLLLPDLFSKDSARRTQVDRETERKTKKNKDNQRAARGGGREGTHYMVSGGPMMVICHSNTLQSSTSPAEKPSMGFRLSSASEGTAKGARSSQVASSDGREAVAECVVVEGGGGRHGARVRRGMRAAAGVRGRMMRVYVKMRRLR
jgi:hypothetical protein